MSLSRALKGGLPGLFVFGALLGWLSMSCEAAVAAGSADPVAQADVDGTAATDRQPDELAKLMEQGRQAIAAGDYATAIRVYNRVLESPNSPYAQDALEYLGLARERNGQVAQAKAIYEQYLTLYPKGPGAERVGQRLAGLVTARETLKEKMPDERPATPGSMVWTGSGTLSQYYRRDAFSFNGGPHTVDQSALISDLDLAARGRGEDYDVRGRFNGGYTYDFLGQSDRLARLSTLYIDVSRRGGPGFSARLGRQTRSEGGVFGRFDGLLLSYQTTGPLRIDLVGGSPVERSTDTSINTDQRFYGVGFDFASLIKDWDYSVYTLEERTGGLTDRRAVGGEARYFDDTRSLLALVDYDLLFKELNMASLLGTWTADERTSYNLSLNQIKSPFLTVGNAIIGQPITQVSDLLGTFSQDQVRRLALDRTAESRSISGGVSRGLSERFQLNADVTVSRISSTPASGGVPGTEATGNEYLYALQLICNKLLTAGDVTILGAAFAKASTSDTTTLSFDSRYPLADALRLNPRLRLDYRRFGDGTAQWITTPSFRMEYRHGHYLELDAEVGGQWSNHDTPAGNERISGYYVYAGYILGF
jgi:tetratricopeptide (TPR) repeat protein